MEFYQLNPNVMIRKIKNKIFMVNPFLDYTKCNLPEITPKAEMICNFLKTPHSKDELVKEFGNSALEFINYCKSDSYINDWNDNKHRNYFSDLVKGPFNKDRTFYGCSFELTPVCNFRCVHCYLDEYHNQGEILSKSDIFKIIDKLDNAGLFLIFFTGGDPFTRKDFKDIYIYTKRKGIQVALFTNGSLINDDWIDLFKIYPPVEVDISLYGSNEDMYQKVTKTKGMFAKVIENINKLKNIGVNVSLKCPIINILEDDLGNMINLSKDLHVPFRFTFDINPTMENGCRHNFQVDPKKAAKLYMKYSSDIDNVRNNLLEYEKTGKELPRTRYKCNTGRCSCFIDFKGNMCPCVENRKDSKNLLENDFDDLWSIIKKNSYDKIPDNVDYKCLKCKLITICKNCPAVRERAYGDPLIVKEADCELAEELYKELKKGEKNEGK